MSDAPLPKSEIILYQTEDGRTRIQCRFENDTLWLTQALIAELFDKDVRTINEHLVNIFDEGELRREATIRKFRMVRIEGKREVAREIEHYNLDAILAVGFRVRSHRGTQLKDTYSAEIRRLAAVHFEAKLSQVPTGRLYASPGQRPGLCIEYQTALKGRSKPCPNPSHASTSTSFSAPRTASESFPTGFAIRSMLTWPPCCKTLAAIPCSSTLSKTTFTSSLNWPAPSPLVQPWRMSKKRLPNGSRRKAVSSPDSRGRQVMERLRSPNPTYPPSVNTSQTSGNIIAKNRFRRNTGHFWNGIRSPSMSGMSGIDTTVWVALSGLDLFSMAHPGRCPGLAWICPFGAQEGSASKAPTGRHHHSLGQRPRFPTTPLIPAPTGRPNRNGGAA